jgi:triacylglycerol lipase
MRRSISGFNGSRLIGRIARGVSALLLCTIAAAQPVLAADEAPIDRVRGAVYSSPGGEKLKADLYQPQGAGPFPAILVVHGGAWRSGNRAQLAWAAQIMARRGYVAVAIEYRHAPKAPFPAQIEDCQAAVAWMRDNAKQFRIDPQHIGAYGYSAGGHLVALLGVLDDAPFAEIIKPASAKTTPEKTVTDKTVTDKPAAEKPAADKPAGAEPKKPSRTSTRVQAVVAGGAPVNFQWIPKDAEYLAFWLGGTRGQKPDIYRQASPTSYISADDPPMFFYHGSSDVLVPPLSPQAMVALLKAAKVPADMHLVDKAGHIQAMFDSKALDASLDFFDRNLKPKPAR